jgi:hypothetical protein
VSRVKRIPLSRFLQDCDEHFLLLPVDRPVIDQAVTLTQNHRLRRYEAVQLAAVLVASNTLQQHNQSVPLSVSLFVTSDRALRAAATSSPGWFASCSTYVSAPPLRADWLPIQDKHHPRVAD